MNDKRLHCIGSGDYGGKARGLTFIRDVLISQLNNDDYKDIDFEFPSLTVICTDAFDNFMKRNDLYEIAYSDLPDVDIATAFQNAHLPYEILGDLGELIEQVHEPLAVRSSGLLEDSLYEPFAGVYGTKMIPNNHPDRVVRFRQLEEAIKFVYASTYFQSAKDYIAATQHSIYEEKMAVIIQKVVGKLHRKCFYPELSGVARSYNYYPMNRAKNEDGVVNLALGLGKTIVDGDVCWTYSPAYPKVDPPYRSVEEMLRYSQNEFWAINMIEPPIPDPTSETEYLSLENITTAEKDGTLHYVASTYDSASGRLIIGTSREGPRVITFAPLLVWEQLPLNQLIKNVLNICEETFHAPVEIEFAMTFTPNRFSFLQVRQMVVARDRVEITPQDLADGKILVASKHVIGNGIRDDIKDIVFVKKDTFETRHTRSIASELSRINAKLLADNRPYLLIAIGRLGTTDPWLGIPVKWAEISGAKIIVETVRTDFKVELSQGSHFFHNLTNMGVGYFSVILLDKFTLDWDWLEVQPVIEETEFLRHARLGKPLLVKIDGRKGEGVILKEG
jgi:hypothetical protein